MTAGVMLYLVLAAARVVLSLTRSGPRVTRSLRSLLPSTRQLGAYLDCRLSLPPTSDLIRGSAVAHSKIVMTFAITSSMMWSGAFSTRLPFRARISMVRG